MWWQGAAGCVVWGWCSQQLCCWRLSDLENCRCLKIRSNSNTFKIRPHWDTLLNQWRCFIFSSELESDVTQSINLILPSPPPKETDLSMSLEVFHETWSQTRSPINLRFFSQKQKSHAIFCWEIAWPQNGMEVIRGCLRWFGFSSFEWWVVGWVLRKNDGSIGWKHGRFPEKEVHVSNEKRAPGCLASIGDEILPNYIGIMYSNKPWNKDPYLY